MPHEFDPRLDVLPPAQLRLWQELVELPPEFVLYGGTAIALYLGHRQSIDFDLFSNRPLDPAKLLSTLPLLRNAEVTQLEPNTLSCLIDRGGAVRLSFFGVPRLPRLGPPSVARGHGMQVAPLLDLAATKVSVIQLRAELKDYLDVDAILADGRIGLVAALRAAAEMYGPSFSPMSALKALTYFEDGSARELPASSRQRLSRAAGHIDFDVLK